MKQIFRLSTNGMFSKFAAKKFLPAILVAVLLFSNNISAQIPGWKPTPNDTLVSPRVNGDKTVTFSIYAPNAKEVFVSGDYKSSWGGDTLKKDDVGVWSFTTPTLVPDFYTYTLTVDGVKTFDPKNIEFKPGVSGLENVVEVPGEGMEFQANNPVPHGEIREVWYNSTATGTQRRMHIYTPPGYEQSTNSYPVFYLQHGAGDDDYGWPTIGRAGFILDNLIANKKAKPMIVVMADGSRTRTGRFQPGMTLELIMNTDKFGDDLLNNIIPFTESHYRVIANSENRAFAGLSMGGLQVLWFGLPNYEKFAYMGIFSMGIAPEATAAYEKMASKFFDDPEKTNSQIKLLWIGYGDNDFLKDGAKNMVKFFNDKKIKFVLNESGGGHTWINWRRYLNEFVPLLFK